MIKKLVSSSSNPNHDSLHPGNLDWKEGKVYRESEDNRCRPPCYPSRARKTAESSAGFRKSKSRSKTCPAPSARRTPWEGYDSSFGLPLLGFYAYNIPTQSCWCFNMEWKQEKEPCAQSVMDMQKPCDPDTLQTPTTCEFKVMPRLHREDCAGQWMSSWMLERTGDIGDQMGSCLIPRRWLQPRGERKIESLKYHFFPAAW